MCCASGNDGLGWDRKGEVAVLGAQPGHGPSILTSIREPSCYGGRVGYVRCALELGQRGEITTTRINRRALLARSGAAVFGSTVAATACATEGAPRDLEPPDKLEAVIEAHSTAYAAFRQAIHEVGGSSRDHDRASQEEEMALLAICAYPAVSEGDRLAKAQYLLEVEARGELDLPDHIQALLRSTMFKT